MSVMPSLEGIAEFRQLDSNYSAEYGLSAGSTMTTVLKSGTKTFHASAWEYNRNNALDARNYFNPAPNPVAKLNFNTFGFNVGGQVPIAKSTRRSSSTTWSGASFVRAATTTKLSLYRASTAGILQALRAFQLRPCAKHLVGSAAGQVFSAAGITGFSTCDASGKITTAVPFPGNAIPSSLI